MSEFKDGYEYFVENSGSHMAAEIGEEYVENVNEQILKLKTDLNSFNGYNTSTESLKGDIAEFWHSDTYNINAVINDSDNRAFTDRSHGFASTDVSSNFDKNYQLKYYKTGTESARNLSQSISDRFSKYNGKASKEEYYAKRGYSVETENEPIYYGQTRIVPSDQVEEAIKWLKDQIENSNGFENKKYVDTLNNLTDRIKDNEGNASIPLSKDDAEFLAGLAKEGKIDSKVLKIQGVSTETLITFEHVFDQAIKAGTSAAMISIVLRMAPEIYDTIKLLVDSGKIDKEQIKKLGFTAIDGGAEAFINGSIAAAVTTSCSAGLCGEALKDINPSLIGMTTVIAMNTLKNAFQVANGEMNPSEMIHELVKTSFISTCSLIAGGVAETYLPLSGFAYYLGSFLGSILGTYAYDISAKKVVDLLYGDEAYSEIRKSADYLNYMALEIEDYYTAINYNNEISQSNLKKAEKIQDQVKSNFDMFENKRRQ